MTYIEVGRSDKQKRSKRQGKLRREGKGMKNRERSKRIKT